MSVIWVFNKRLFHLIAEARRGRSYIVTPSKKNEAARNFNNRQLSLLAAVSKHALLVGVMVGANAIWMVWFTAVPIWVSSRNRTGHLLDNCIYCVVILVQLVTLYLSFDFATAWYHRVCPEGRSTQVMREVLWMVDRQTH